jgi:hypothetical protein
MRTAPLDSKELRRCLFDWTGNNISGLQTGIETKLLIKIEKYY